MEVSPTAIARTLHYLHTYSITFTCTHGVVSTDSKLDRRDKLPVINEVHVHVCIVLYSMCTDDQLDRFVK